jgi:fluoride exporter
MGRVARFLLVCLGGALGSGARYLMATWASAAFGPAFPRGTILVNLVGSFLLSVIMTVAALTESIPPTLRIFLAAGVMGGFTTYSSFNWETIALAQDGALGLAALNMVLTVVGCLVAGLAGVILVHRVVG